MGNITTTEELIPRNRDGLQITRFHINDFFTKKLPTTPFQVVQAVTGKIIFPLWIILKLDWFANYTNVDASCYAGLSPVVDTEIDVRPFINISSFDSDFLASSKDMYSIGGAGLNFDDLISAAYDGTNAVSKALNLRVVNGALGDFTGGDARNSIQGKIGYITL